jgi:hypothetical protein
VDEQVEAAIRRLLKRGAGTKAVVRETGACPSVVVRVKRELGIEVQPWTRQAEGAAE